MDLLEAIVSRHAVRKYSDRAIDSQTIAELNREIDACNRESGLRIQLVTEEDRAFGGIAALWLGKFRGVKNYIALVASQAENAENAEEKAGYYGERLVLSAQRLGLNTCWVGATYRKDKCACRIEDTERLICVIALGYGENQGKPHKSKRAEEVCESYASQPDWFVKGLEAALLAPTAMNRQAFTLQSSKEGVTIRTFGAFREIDRGILKYHFECGSGKNGSIWKSGEEKGKKRTIGEK